MEIDLSLAGTRVFIVEDEALLVLTLQDLLAELGCEVVASALRIDDALAKGRVLAFDVAILDVNVAGERIDPVADLLAGRGLPFFFTTGYNRTSLPRAHRARTLVAKPYRVTELQAALGAVLSD